GEAGQRWYAPETVGVAPVREGLGRGRGASRRAGRGAARARGGWSDELQRWQQRMVCGPCARGLVAAHRTQPCRNPVRPVRAGVGRSRTDEMRLGARAARARGGWSGKMQLPPGEKTCGDRKSTRLNSSHVKN